MRNVPEHRLIELLEAGASASVVGLVTDAGEPFATRAWGVHVLSEAPLRLRALLPAGSLARIGLRAGDRGPFAIALTAADVRTLDAVQVKGTGRDLEVPDREDDTRFDAYSRQLFEAIHRSDGNPIELLHRMAPADRVACTIDVEHVFDQTPGPSAGAPLSASGQPQ